MNRSLLIPVCLFLGAALCQPSAPAQPQLPPDTPHRAPAFSVAELEKFVGGRTLISLDLKNATLEEVAVALSQASNQKIEARAPAPAMRYTLDGKPPVALAAPLYSLSAAQTPFWPTLRAWQLAARRASKTAPQDAATPSVPSVKTFVTGSPFGASAVPNSLGLSKNAAGWWLQPDNSLADGRAVTAWPFLVIANDLKRSQDGSLSDEGMNEPDNPAPPPGLAAPANPIAAPKTEEKTPDAEHWNDQLTLSGKVLIDPKLKPLNLRCEVLEALDDKGNTLNYSGETALRLQIAAPPIEMPKPRLSLETRSSTGVKTTIIDSGIPTHTTGFSQSLRIPLRFQPGMGKKLVRLRGVLRFSVVTRSQHWETTELDKPINGTVFQNGAEFNVQFKGLQKTASGWSAGFAAQSRGPQLEQIWKERVPSQALVMELNGSLRTVERSSFVGTSWSGTGNQWGFTSALDFEGSSPMSLVDENGRVFEMNDGQFSSAMTRDRNAAPIVSPDKSPLPPDLAQNWTFDESRNFDFIPPGGATGADAKMGKPVKLMLDLPLERREVVVPFEFTDLPLPPS